MWAAIHGDYFGEDWGENQIPFWVLPKHSSLFAISVEEASGYKYTFGSPEYKLSSDFLKYNLNYF